MAKNSNKKDKKDNKYNAENEIIIGVTTKPKEKVRVDKNKSTRTNNAKNKQSNNSIQNKNRAKDKNKKVTQKTNTKKLSKEKQIKQINIKKIIISIIILLFIVLCGTIYYLTTPVFNVSGIEIYGNEKNTIDTYISLSKINIGDTNIFEVTNKGIKGNIKENSYVEDVKIERKLPNIIKIYVTERNVSYQVKYYDNYIYLDNQGYILEIAEYKKDVPFIDGFSTVKGNINIGERLIEEDLIKLNVVAKIINYCKYNTIENKITSIDVTQDTDYKVHFKEDKKVVYLGDASNLSERLSLLKTILRNEKDKEIEIFMNGDLNKDNVYIRYAEK